VVLDVLDHHRDLGDPLGITRLEVRDLLEKRLDDLVLLDALGDDSPWRPRQRNPRRSERTLDAGTARRGGRASERI
jgi:hypothetical protein